MERQTYMLTGSHGHLGSALKKRLLSMGHKVITLPRELLYSPEDLSRFLRDNPADYLYSLHSYGNLHSQQESASIYEANVTTNFNLLEASKATKLHGFLFVSSSSIFLDKQTLYSACKSAVEELTLAYNHVPIKIVYPYTITGLGDQEEHLIPTLISAAYSGSRVPFVYNPTHDFIDVEDVVTLLTKNFFHIPSHLGTGVATTNGDILNMVEELTGRRINFEVTNSLREYDTTLEWKAPEVNAWCKPVREVIKEMVTQYKEEHGIK